MNNKGNGQSVAVHDDDMGYGSECECVCGLDLEKGRCPGRDKLVECVLLWELPSIVIITTVPSLVVDDRAEGKMET